MPSRGPFFFFFSIQSGVEGGGVCTVQLGDEVKMRTVASTVGRMSFFVCRAVLQPWLQKRPEGWPLDGPTIQSQFISEASRDAAVHEGAKEPWPMDWGACTIGQPLGMALPQAACVCCLRVARVRER